MVPASGCPIVPEIVSPPPLLTPPPPSTVHQERSSWAEAGAAMREPAPMLNAMAGGARPREWPDRVVVTGVLLCAGVVNPSARSPSARGHALDRRRRHRRFRQRHALRRRLGRSAVLAPLRVLPPRLGVEVRAPRR